MKEHHYQLTINWTGNLGRGTASYTSYSRDHEIQAGNKTIIEGSSDPAFRGNPQKYNPEELFLSTLSSCHMLFVLHLCAVNNITIISYIDRPEGIMIEEKSGRGYFERVTLKPHMTIKEPGKVDLALKLHHEANSYCFIANSVNFEVEHEPVIDIDT